MSRYPMKKLAEFCRTGSGGTPPRSQMERYYEDGNIPWVKSGELRESLITWTDEHVTKAALKETSVKLVPAGAILLAMYGATVGRLAILGIESTTNQAVCHIVPDSSIADTRYLYHAISAQVPAIIAMGVGAAQPNISQGLIRELAVSLPGLPEQRRIAAILDQADALRAKRREALAQLDSLTQSIFTEMFGDPATNPKNCVPACLGETVSEMQYGPRFYNEAYSPEGMRIVRITDLDASGSLDFDSMPRMDIDEDAHAQFILRPGDIVFARTGATVGKVALIDLSSPPCIAGAYFIRLRFKDSVLPEYAYSVLRTKSVQSLIARQSRQAAQQNFSGPGLRRLPMPIPSLTLQQEFKARLTVIQQMTSVHQRSLAQLSLLLASLQHRAFRGEL